MTETGTASTAIEPALVARFAEALARLNPQGGRVGLAVSGGTDSMAMLLLAHTAIPEGFEVATVNHGLRPEAADECALVVAACEARGVPCEVLAVNVGEGNVQEQARVARYAALAEWAQARGLDAIATAHHADDQAETLLMRLNRGSGVAGLAGIRERSTLGPAKVALIRPLLAFRRHELSEVVKDIPVADDPSNRDDRYDRVGIRKALQTADWIDPAMLARSAANLADDEQALAAFADWAWGEYVSREGEGLAIRPIMPRAIALRVLARAIEELGGSPRGGDVARLLDRLEADKNGNVGGVMVKCAGDLWKVAPEPPRKSR